MEMINWSRPSDSDLLYLMQMWIRGYDAQGASLLCPNQQLIAMSKLYLQRQDMLPSNLYQMPSQSKSQVKSSVYYKSLKMSGVKGLASAEKIKSKYKLTNLIAFDRKAYKKEKQEQ